MAKDGISTLPKLMLLLIRYHFMLIFRSKQQRVIHLVNMGIAESTVSKLLAILEKEGSIELLGGILKQASKQIIA